MANDIKQRAEFYANVLSIILMKSRIGKAEVSFAGIGARHLSIAVRPSNPLKLKVIRNIVEPFALAARIKNCLVERNTGYIIFQVELPEKYWKTITRHDLLSLPSNTIGLAENKVPVPFDFSNPSAPHALFAGTTGSGKSEAVKSALVGIAKQYPVEGIKVLICDPELEYDDFNNLAHLTMINSEAQPILQYAGNELTHRVTNNIKNDVPLLVVIDEAYKQGSLAKDHDLETVKILAKRGRKYNIHLLLASQKPNHKDMPHILDLLLNRFVGLVSDPIMSYALTGKGKLGAHLLTGSGDFLHSVGDNTKRFQVAMATNKDYKELPRTETKKVEIAQSNTVFNLPELPASKQVGRPRNQLSAKLLALYVFRNSRISIAQANKLGISRGIHDLHKLGAVEFIETIRRMRQ